MKRKFEETMQGTTSCIDGRYTGRCQHYMFLPGIGAYILQKSGFTRTRLPRQKYRLTGVLNEIQCMLKFFVTGIYLHESIY